MELLDMRVTVDIDDRDRIAGVKRKIEEIGMDYEVERSTGGNYHVIISDLDLTFAESVALRRFLGDDPKRLGLDFAFMLYPLKPKQVLFNAKVIDGELVRSSKVIDGV